MDSVMTVTPKLFDEDGEGKYWSIKFEMEHE